MTVNWLHSDNPWSVSCWYFSTLPLSVRFFQFEMISFLINEYSHIKHCCCIKLKDLTCLSTSQSYFTFKPVSTLRSSLPNLSDLSDNFKRVTQNVLNPKRQQTQANLNLWELLRTAGAEGAAAHTARSARAEDRNLYLLFVPRSGILVQQRELSWDRGTGKHGRGQRWRVQGQRVQEGRQADRLEGWIQPLVTEPRQSWSFGVYLQRHPSRHVVI